MRTPGVFANARVISIFLTLAKTENIYASTDGPSRYSNLGARIKRLHALPIHDGGAHIAATPPSVNCSQAHLCRSAYVMQTAHREALKRTGLG